jgi:hypothetical protein
VCNRIDGDVLEVTHSGQRYGRSSQRRTRDGSERCPERPSPATCARSSQGRCTAAAGCVAA